MASRWARLEPFAWMYSDMDRAIEEHVQSLTSAQLRSLDALTNKPGRTNCWWAVYQVAPLVRQAIQDERYRRKHRSRRSARSVEDGTDG